MEPKCDLLIIAGPPLHGKTSLGRVISNRFGFKLIDVDELRPIYFPNILAQGGVRDRSGEYFLAGDAEVTTACYYLVVGQIVDLLQSGTPVVFTGALSKDVMKQPFLDLTRNNPRYRSTVIKLASTLTDEAAQARIDRRLSEGSNSPIVTVPSYRDTIKLQTPWPQDGSYKYHEIEVGPPLNEVLEIVTKLIT